jgi:hypothetical protein
VECFGGGGRESPVKHEAGEASKGGPAQAGKERAGGPNTSGEGPGGVGVSHTDTTMCGSLSF